MGKKSSKTAASAVEPGRNQVPSVPSLPMQGQKQRGGSELAPVRQLQIVAMLVAILWIVGAAVVSRYLVESVTGAEFARQNEKVKTQTALIAQLIEKELHLAEQIAVALSHEADIITLTTQMNARAAEIRKMTIPQRKSFLKNNSQSRAVDALFDRLQNNVDLTSVFLLDAGGNCVASGYLEAIKDGRKLGCWGGNYATRQYFKQTRRKGEGRQFAVGRRAPQPSLFFARSVTSGGRFAGAVVVRVDAARLASSLRDMMSVTWVTDRNGISISSTRDAYVFRHIGKTFRAVPSQSVIEDVYAQKILKTIPIKTDREFPRVWQLWRLNEAPMVFHRMRVKGRDFDVWHGVNAESALSLHERSWYFAIVIIVSGLLLIMVIERVLDAHQRRLASMATLAEVNRSLEQVSNRLYAIATKDHLTQISSRGYFLQRLKTAVREAHTERHPMCLMQIDIDFFKRINDTHGHPAGDAAIRQMADICRQAVHGRDPLGRLGGEEFAIGLIDCTIPSAIKVAEKLRESVASTPLIFEGETIRFSCSIGLAGLMPDSTPESLLRASDQALYNAKNAGRNCVKVAEK